MNFADRFKDFCEELHKQTQSLMTSTLKEIPVAQMNIGVRYNIHKRSLPVGLDKPVMFGLSEEESEIVLSKFFKTKMIENKDDTKTLIYYDRVREDGVRSSVFDNPPGIIIESSDTTEFNNWVR
jgi:hypothetical protein